MHFASGCDSSTNFITAASYNIHWGNRLHLFWSAVNLNGTRMSWRLKPIYHLSCDTTWATDNSHDKWKHFCSWLTDHDTMSLFAGNTLTYLLTYTGLSGGFTVQPMSTSHRALRTSLNNANKFTAFNLYYKAHVSEPINNDSTFAKVFPTLTSSCRKPWTIQVWHWMEEQQTLTLQMILHLLQTKITYVKKWLLT